MSALLVAEVFPTMQGEGSQAGTPTVFVRLAGCNAKSRSLVCSTWCDTDYRIRKSMEPEALVDLVVELTEGWARPHVTLTGGEPALYLMWPEGQTLVELLQDFGAGLAIETNGTVDAPLLHAGAMHVTMSPKALRKPGDDPLAHVALRKCDDLKVVVPQWPEDHLRQLVQAIEHRTLWLQPLDEPDAVGRVQHALDLAGRLGGRVSLQTHKLAGLP